MTKSLAMLALAASALFSTARAACVDIDQYLDIPSPMKGDMEINLDAVDTIECEEIEEFDGPTTLEIVTVDGGTLTLKSSNSVRFVNMGFKVETGASIVFDMPKTEFGPNTFGTHRGDYNSYTVSLEEGASATFLGELLTEEVTNVFSLFRNAGTIAFEDRFEVNDSGNVFRSNTGVTKFSGDATFKNNRYLALQTLDSAYVTFEKKATFDNNAHNFDGAGGCSVTNEDAATVIFRGDATFLNNACKESAAVSNEATMTFQGKAYFNDNWNNFDGGGVINRSGTILFKEDVQFNNNTASEGGGIFARNGEVIFDKGVIFDGNTATTGAAFAIGESGSLTFKKPNEVISKNAILDKYSNEQSCTFGEVKDGGILIGFTGDDVCIPAEDAA